MIWTCLMCIVCLLHPSSGDGTVRYLNEYVVKTNEADRESLKIDLQHLGLKLKTQILTNIYVYVRESQKNVSDSEDTAFVDRLEDCCYGKVLAAEQVVQTFKPLWPVYGVPVTDVEGDDQPKTTPPTSQASLYERMGILDVWKSGITGKGVTIAVPDVGIYTQLTDLFPNIAFNLSYNVVANDSNIEPEYFGSYPELNGVLDHGTNAAGLIAASKNQICGDGVAYDAMVAGLKIFKVEHVMDSLLSGFTDAHAAEGLSRANQHVDVYSNSWSTETNFDPYHFGLASQTALEDGVKWGRHGKGSVFVFPVGALADGYTNSPNTITVNEVLSNGEIRSKGALLCACTMTVTFGEGIVASNAMKTSSGHGFDNCTKDFRGTSAATAIVSGIIALALEANNELTWRDIQHLVVEASGTRNVRNPNEFLINGAGKRYHHKLGFGFLDAAKLVNLARNWSHVGEQVKEETKSEFQLSGDKSIQTASIFMSNSSRVLRIEHVVVELSYTTANENETEIVLRSPAKTASILMDRWQSANTTLKSRNDVKFLSVHFWGEAVVGTWTVMLSCRYRPRQEPVRLSRVKLTFYGTGNASIVVADVPPGPNTHDKGGQSGGLIAGVIVAVMAVVVGVSLLIVWKRKSVTQTSGRSCSKCPMTGSNPERLVDDDMNDMM